MIRDRRNTGDWFDHDRRGSLGDRAINVTIGPGMYDSPSQTKKIVSHNTGSVPFGVNQNTKKNLFGVIEGAPGPGDYEHSKVCLTKPIAMKKANRMSLLGAVLRKHLVQSLRDRGVDVRQLGLRLHQLDTTL